MERRRGAEAEEVAQTLEVDDPVSDLLERVAEPKGEEAPPRSAKVPILRTAQVVSIKGKQVDVQFRRSRDVTAAELAPEVDRDLVEQAMNQKDAVLVETEPGSVPLVVGVLQTRSPREIHLKAAVVHIEGDEEVLIRSGRAALRIRQDGDVEIVGSRIHAASRGLFRLVGRILRLN